MPKFHDDVADIVRAATLDALHHGTELNAFRVGLAWHGWRSIMERSACPYTMEHDEYAAAVKQRLESLGFRIDT